MKLAGNRMSVWIVMWQGEVPLCQCTHELQDRIKKASNPGEKGKKAAVQKVSIYLEEEGMDVSKAEVYYLRKGRSSPWTRNMKDIFCDASISVALSVSHILHDGNWAFPNEAQHQ